MARAVNDQKVEEIRKSVLKEAHKEGKKKHLIEYERSIYYDQRQYSVKIPAEIYKLVGYKKGDKLKFIVDNTDPSNKTISVEYVRTNE